MPVVRFAAGMAAIVATLAVAATPADAWVEIEPYAVGDHGAATCLRDAGDGRLTVLGPLGARTTATDVLAIDPAGLRRVGRERLGWQDQCAAAAPGATLAAGVRANPPGGSPQQVVLSDGTPVAPPMPGIATNVAIAGNAAGAIVVVWRQERLRLLSAARPKVRTWAAVRPAGAAVFAPAVPLEPIRRGPWSSWTGAGIDDAGRATVAWAAGERVRVKTLDVAGRLATADAVPGGDIGPAALAVEGSGRTLLATSGFDGAVYERATPDATLGRVGSIGSLPLTSQATMAVRGDGAAVAAWRGADGGVLAAIRRPGGAFREAEAVTPVKPAIGSAGGFLVATSSGRRPEIPDDPDPGTLDLALAGDGEIVLAWVRPMRGSCLSSVRAARGTLQGGFGRAARLSSPCRFAGSVRTTLAGGRPAIAWTDAATLGWWPVDRGPRPDGRVHAALPGPAAPASGPRPELHARLIGPRALRPSRPLRLRLRCAVA